MTNPKTEVPPPSISPPPHGGSLPGEVPQPRADSGDVIGWCERHFATLAVAVLLLTSFNLIARIDHEIVMEWDESLYATSALEMVQSNRWLAPTFHGSIDYYNSKPPLNIWLIALSFKLFGQSLYSLRLVSMASAWLTALTLLLWTRRRFGAAPALLATVMVSTFHGFLYVHAARTANPDALLALLVLLTTVVLSEVPDRPWARVWLGPIAAAVFLLKGMAVLMPLVMILAMEFLAARPQRARWKSLGVACLLFLAPVLAWGVARWRFDQWQFLGRMVAYDFVAGTLTPLEGHARPFWFYLHQVQKDQYDWLVAGLVALLVLSMHQWRTAGLPKPGRSDKMLVGIWAGTTLLVPTLMRTKLPWYINPFFPALALGVGWLVASALAIPRQDLRRGAARTAVVFTLVLALGVAEGRLVYYSFHYRDVDRSLQGVLLDKARPMAGKRLFGVRLNRAELFAARAFAEVEPVSLDNIDAFWRESLPGDYLLLHKPLRDARLTVVRSTPSAHLHRRLE